jgi:hypothetical protein
MKVRILKVSTGELIDGVIRKGRPNELPSIQTGWKFNFDKHIKRLSHATAYVLETSDNPGMMEGCLIFQMVGKVLPYMAFVEIAPHNRTEPKMYDYVGGCLIAFACRLSLTQGKEHHKGWLTFKVMEEHPEDQIKLMAVYSQKYGAVRVDETTMLIGPENAQLLIQTYLERDSA